MEARELLAYLAIKYRGEYKPIFNAIKEKERVDEDEAKTLLSNAGDYITLIDDNYPEELKKMYQPPIVLFYKGDITLLQKEKLLAVVGSREVTEYGRDVTNHLVTGLLKDKEGKDTVIVSGLARGVDTIAHTATLDASGKTIAVLGSGIDVVYPKANESLYKRIIDNGGLIISEYPKGVEPAKEHFPMRNRIVVGLVDAVLVTEANKMSGTSITTQYALVAGKDILAVPNRITDANNLCNRLIQDVAHAITSVEDLVYFTSKKS